MFKKLIVIIILFGLVVAGLQMFGGRDFGQVSLAWDKYNHGGDISSFLSDIGTIFSGGRVNESALPMGRYADQVMYRWKDELGQIHVSERKPNVDVFEEIRLGDMKFDIQEGMSKEEIEKILKKKDE
ncbi:hypothetical protein [Aliikangiella coralliicola]|uniref:DUF4124 domain-containing protein n=1 Tax=Aliikangiella coralliicola TaxID=2592383 RepID=A0A545U4S9_9GAMM|nr:hypothetical protein [Aliikangiella coralliicola]TQV84476.1 hypothetical protein FLL46_22950 [Aliikangiella coralliicola]